MRHEFLEGLPMDFGSVNCFALGIDGPKRLYFCLAGGSILVAYSLDLPLEASADFWARATFLVVW